MIGSDLTKWWHELMAALGLAGTFWDRSGLATVVVILVLFLLIAGTFIGCGILISR